MKIPVMAVAAAAMLTVVSSQAEAKGYRYQKQPDGFSTVTVYCGDRVCGFEEAKPRRARATSMKIEKKQQYVKPHHSTDKLITREHHEASVGIIRSKKTGATARVGARYASKFQAYIDDLENNFGARIYYMGGIRPGHCSNGSQHPCGKALDVCQDSRGRVSGARDCHLPNRVALIAIAARHGLFEGGKWCNHDMGHAQVDNSGTTCGNKLVDDIRKFKTATSTANFQP